MVQLRYEMKSRSTEAATRGSSPVKKHKPIPSTRMAWAIDPLEKNPSVAKKMRDLLLLWCQDARKIIPVTVLSPLDLGWPMPITPKLKKELFTRAIENSHSLLKKLSLPQESAEILVSSHVSLLSSVEKALQFATKQKSEAIALYSRSKPGSEDSGLGSFAELAISTAKIPVLVVGEKAQVPQKISKILFPTDFTTHRKKAFAFALQWARRYHAELVLYHHAGVPLAPMTFTSYGAPLEALWMQSAYEANQTYEKKLGDKLIAAAKKKGVKCRLISDFTPATWSQRVIDINKNEKADLILISVRRGVWGQALFGGKIRKLFAEAECPLMFIHSK